MKQIRWSNFSLASKIVIEVSVIAGILFAMNVGFYMRINRSMQMVDKVYMTNADITQLAQAFEEVQDNVYRYLKVKSSQALNDYYQSEGNYRELLGKLNGDNISDSGKILEKIFVKCRKPIWNIQRRQLQPSVAETWKNIKKATTAQRSFIIISSRQ